MGACARAAAFEKFGKLLTGRSTKSGLKVNFFNFEFQKGWGSSVAKIVKARHRLCEWVDFIVVKTWILKYKH